jgi:ribA/ribD-fused uncharacterized protein
VTEQITRFVGRWGFLSNFHLSRVYFEGIVYPSGEHAYNAGKTLDRAARCRIACAPTPKQAKKLGRRLELRPGWENIARYDVMWDVLWAKFAQHPRYAAGLLSTGDALLVEGNNWHDNQWGCCICPKEKCAAPGKNNLGLMLMDLRTELRRLPRWQSWS